MKYYKVSEEQLKRFLVNQHEMTALSFGGVDNWEWYSESCSNYIEDLCKETGADPDDTWFEELAFDDLKNYEEI